LPILIIIIYRDLDKATVKTQRQFEREMNLTVERSRSEMFLKGGMGAARPSLQKTFQKSNRNAASEWLWILVEIKEFFAEGKPMSQSFTQKQLGESFPSSLDKISASRLLSLIDADLDRTTEFLRAFETDSFRLGEEIYQFSPTQNDHSRFLYLVGQGRVRVLCQDETQRSATAQLLEADSCFGADGLWVQFQSYSLDGSPRLDGNWKGEIDTLLPYQVIAASLVRVVRVPVAQVTVWLTQFPRLRQHLIQQMQQRDRLIFLKTMTGLRSLPSHQLAPIATALHLETLAAGTVLAQAHSSENGTGHSHYWLRQGKLQGIAQEGLKAGWGYPENIPSDWVAETELKVYRLAADLYRPYDRSQSDRDPATSQTLPATSAKPDEPMDSANEIPHGMTKTLPRPSHNRVTPLPKNTTRNLPSLPVSQGAIAFPKPLHRRWFDHLRRFPWVEQQSSSDCGAACLGMIARYWGKQFPLHVLRDLAEVGRSGSSLKSLGKAAETLGFQARPVRASLGRMVEQSSPWVAHWQGNHFVVVYRCRGRKMVIADPAMGRRSLTQSEFLEHWTGYALLLEPTEKLKKTEIQQGSLLRYLDALSPYRFLIFQIILFSVLIQGFGVITPLFTQIILDRVVTQGSLSTLNVFAFGLFLFSIWSLCLASVRQYLLAYFSNRLDATLISGFINHALTLPLKFFESRRVGDILTRVQENQKIQRFLIQQVVLAWLNFLTGFVYLGLMFYYNWRLTLLVLIMIPPIVLLTLGATPLLRKVSREVFKEASDQNSTLVEMMSGMGTVKAAAAEKELRWRWEDTLTRQINAQFRGQKLGIRLQAANGLINSIGSTALLWYGATLVIQNQLTIGQFVAFNMMIGYVISPVVALANLWDELQEVLISVERLNDVFAAQPESSAQKAILLNALRGEVEFQDVTFRYGEDDNQNTLQNLSFQVQPGQTIAIVGRSGSGKSTLVKLLEGLYHPSQGRVFVDGHDLRHVSLPALRSQFGVVPQECFLFSGSILENITLYRPEYSLEQVIEAAKLAEAHAFIQSLPLGYHTKVGERGSTLSGGQRQRVAIARALLGNPRILILDEATSSLDTESERRFQQNLMMIRRDRTTFIIAHRLSTVRFADQILVMDQGILVEQGNHEALMQQRGLYYHLAQQQLDL
jgi:ATP-binding cassette subfamily B protein